MKTKIIKELIHSVQKDLDEARQAVTSAKNLAQSEDFKSESKWDTRSIEAGYLAGAQEKRVKELEIELANLENLNLTIKVTIVPGALITTEDKLYFLTVSTGGHKMKTDQGLVHVVSLNSPIGQKLIEEEITILDFK